MRAVLQYWGIAAYLDDRAWLENRRILRLLQEIESHAIKFSVDPPHGDFMTLDAMAAEIALPLDRPLFTPPMKPDLDDGLLATGDDDVPADALFDLVHVDKTRLQAQIWRALQSQNQISLKELVALWPLELGLAELITYMSIASEDPSNVIDDSRRTSISWVDAEGLRRRAVMPLVAFVRPVSSGGEADAPKGASHE